MRWLAVLAALAVAASSLAAQTSDRCTLQIDNVDRKGIAVETTGGVNYFAGGTEAEDDLAAVVDGVETVRRINRGCQAIVAEEIVPGAAVRTREQVRQFVVDNAWGHHACGTCKMGPASDPMAVVDSRFRVYGVRGLRVVDASVFPKIPGFFIVSAVYMISEKARDAVMEDANSW